MQTNNLSSLLKKQSDARPKVARTLLRDQAIGLLRDYIVSGQIPPGTKLVEREIAELLGISRAPVRDALLELEKEGIIEARSDGRYVIQLTEQDIRELYQVRLVLEKLAVELAAKNITPDGREELTAKLGEMRQAIEGGDRAAHVHADVEMHWLVWREAHNAHLLRMLASMVGPVFMFVANNAADFDWHETLALHEELVSCINDGNAAAAAESIEQHLDNALHRSLKAFRDDG